MLHNQLAQSDILKILSSIRKHELKYHNALKKVYSPYPMTGASPYLISKDWIPVFEKVIKASSQRISDFITLSMHNRIPETISLLRSLEKYTSLANYDPHPFFRIDTYFDPERGQLKILEYNVGDPTGFAWSDFMAESTLEILQSEKFSGIEWTHFCISQAIAEEILFRFPKITAESSVRIIAPQESFVHWDHIAIAKIMGRYFRSSSFADPSCLSYSSKGLQDDKGPIEFFFRDAWDEIDGKANYAHLLEALRDQQIPYLNQCAANFADEKILFHYLFTKSLSQRPILDADESLAPHLLESTIYSRPISEEQQSRIVLKPSYGYGGNGIFIGKDQSRSRWAQINDMVEKASQLYLIQEYVRPPKATFDPDRGPQNMTLSLWGCRGRFLGAFARFSSSEIINVHQNGGFVPCLFYS